MLASADMLMARKGATVSLIMTYLFVKIEKSFKVTLNHEIHTHTYMYVHVSMYAYVCMYVYYIDDGMNSR